MSNYFNCLTEETREAIAYLCKRSLDIDDIDTIIDLIQYDEITINVCRNGRYVVWYIDSNGKEEYCMYIDDKTFLSKSEIEEQLL